MPEVCMLVKRDTERIRPVVVSRPVGPTNESNLRAYKVASGLITAAAAGNTILFAWQNPEANQIIVYEVVINISVAGTVGACAIDVGPVANAAANSDTIIDGLLLNAISCQSSLDVTASVGVNADERPKVLDENGGATDWITGYESAIVATTNLVARYYIFYISV